MGSFTAFEFSGTVGKKYAVSVEPIPTGKIIRNEIHLAAQPENKSVIYLRWLLIYIYIYLNIYL